MKHFVAITGASSFTGVWIAREFRERGWSVAAQCSRPKESYTGLRKIRTELLAEKVGVRYALEADRMAEWIREIRPVIWVHHHHWMEKFRAADYDSDRAARIGLQPLPSIIEALSESGCRGIIYSGTFFEPGEGAIAPDYRPTPYALSKRQVWETLSELAASHHIPLSKVVIPDPVGPFENDDRLIPLLIQRARSGEKMSIFTPEVVSDHLPVHRLAGTYVDMAERLLQGETRVARPSGWVGSIGDWVRLVNSELIEKRFGLKPAPLELGSDPSRGGFENPEAERAAIDWEREWDRYAGWLKERSPSF